MRSAPRGPRPGTPPQAAPPHLPAPRWPEPHHAPNAALLIDFDNVTLGVRSDLTKELKTLLGSEIIKGKVAVQRAYADWRRYPQYIVPLSESSIDLIFAPAFGSAKKNATDIRLAIDAIELIFTRPEIGTFILLSGDSDFSSLVIKLKEYGKYVIGVGIRESASDLLIQNCDEYFSYSDLAGLTKEADTPSIQRDPWELVAEAARQMARSNEVMRSDRLKQVMQQLDANFDERNAGFNRFSKFVAEAGNRGLIKLSKLENGQFEISPADGAAPAERPRREERAPAAEAPRAEGEGEGREGGRRRGRRGRGRDRERGGNGAAPAAAEMLPELPQRPEGALTLARAFDLMRDALRQLDTPAGHEAVRLRMAALHGRDDVLLEPARFQRLIRQANDAEVADVRKTGDNEYEIAPHPTDDARARSGVPSRPTLAAPAAAAPERDGGETAPLEAAPAGPRVGLRGRPTRSLKPAQIPLIGVVELDEPSAAVAVSDAVETAAEVDEEAAPARKTSRRGGRGRGGRAKAAADGAGTPKAEKPAKAEKAEKPAKAEAAPKKKAAKRGGRARKSA